MAGYSGTPLPQKIGIKPGHRIFLLNAPADFPSAPVPRVGDVRYVGASAKAVDVVVVFEKSQKVLEEQLPELTSRIVPEGMIWVAWPQKASGIETDLNENLVRHVALPLDLVCGIDETWSGLKLVIRKEHRRKAPSIRT